MLKGLVGRYVIDKELSLRSIGDEQYDALMYALLDDIDVTMHLDSYPYPITKQWIRDTREKWIHRETMEHSGFTRGIFLGDVLVGFAGINDIDASNRHGSLGIVIGSQFQRRRIASRVLDFIVKSLAFGVLPLHRLVIETSEHNVGMRAWGDKHATFEGVKRECTFERGKWRGVASYSILRGEQCPWMTEIGDPKFLIHKLNACTEELHSQCYKRMYDLLYEVIYSEGELVKLESRAVKLDDAKSLFLWGLLMFFGGGGVPGPNLAAAHRCFKTAAEMGHVYSLYFQGRAKTDEPEVSLHCFVEAANAGCPFAAYYAGQEFFKRNDLDNATKYWEIGGVDLDFARRRSQEALLGNGH